MDNNSTTESKQVAPQAARLLEHIKTISEQYGDRLAGEHPDLAEALCHCATELSRFLAEAGEGRREP